MKTKVILIVFSIFTLAFVVKGYLQHPLEAGRLLFAQAFPDGDALTVSQSNTGLQVGYYNVTGEQILFQPLPLSGEIDRLSVQACGAVVQIFINYQASVLDDLSTAYAERLVITLPHAQPCHNTNYLPVVLKGGE